MKELCYYKHNYILINIFNNHLNLNKMKTKESKKLTLKKEVIQELNNDQMNYAFGGCSGLPTGYSPCQANPTRKCSITIMNERLEQKERVRQEDVEL